MTTAESTLPAAHSQEDPRSQTIGALYRAGVTLRAIAIQVGRSYESVRQQALRMGLAPRRHGRAARRRRGTPTTRLATIRRLYTEGRPLHAISLAVGLSDERVRQLVRQMALPRRLGCLAGLLVALSLAWMPLVGAQTQPHRPRQGPNLLTNPNFNGTTSYTVQAGISYDATTSRTADGTGSMRYISNGAQTQVYTSFLTVTPNTPYMFSCYIRTETWPPGNILMNLFRSVAPYFIGHSLNGGNSRPGVWEEMSFVVVPPTGDTVIQLGFGRVYPDSGVGDMWVDDCYFGTGIGFEAPPAVKVPFVGDDVEVDALGNMRVRWPLKTSPFQNVFPLCIYADTARPLAFETYSAQGFNCDAWGNSSTVVPAKNAVSSFNPHGMMPGVQIAQFMWPSGWGFDPGGVNLTNEILAAKAHGIPLLWYYWDNENEFDEWTNPMTMLAHAATADTTGGTRDTPLYVLQGAPNAARMYRTHPGGIVYPNMTGSYGGDLVATGGAGVGGAIDVIQNSENQVTPVVIEQLNIAFTSAAAGSLRQYLYHYLPLGARGIGIWRDCYLNNCDGAAESVTTVPWWPDVPNLRTELDALLPLIREPHWTTWTVAMNQPGIVVGTRNYQAPGRPLAEGHLIVSNASGSTQTITFTLSGLSYTPAVVKNYFTGATVATVTGNQFTTTLPPVGINQGTAVYRLEAAVDPEQPSVTITGPTTGTTYTTAETPLTTLEGTAADLTGVPAGGITVSCSPSCGSPVVSCPSCGPSATSVTWTVASVPLAPNTTTTITVTVTDATAQVATDTLAVSHTAPGLLYVHWPFDADSGVTAADLGTCNCPGTLQAAPPWVGGPRSAGALSFNGVNQYVSSPTPVMGSTVTLSFWVKVAGGTENGTFNMGFGTTRMAAHVPWSDNVLYWDHGDNITTARVSLDFAPYLNTWTYVTLVSNGVDFRAIYINGVRLATSTAVQSAPATLTGLDVGRYNYNNGAVIYYHTGQIDDFRLYPGVLSDADVAALYAAQTSPVLRRQRVMVLD